LRYVPGVIAGGAGLEHDCGTERGIGYFLEPLVCLALFGKKARAAAAAAPSARHSR
jgi:RNA 3'-terminal phosphate cyclase-like protein